MPLRELKPEHQSMILELKRVLKTDPKSPLFPWLAELYRAQGKLVEAYEIAKTGLREYPEKGWAHFIFGHICLEMGKLTESEKEFRSATSILTRDIEPYLMLGSTLMHRRDYSGARVVLVRMEELFPARPEITRFRRYLEQKLMPPMDFGVLETDKIIEKLNSSPASTSTPVLTKDIPNEFPIPTENVTDLLSFLEVNLNAVIRGAEIRITEERLRKLWKEVLKHVDVFQGKAPGYPRLKCKKGEDKTWLLIAQLTLAYQEHRGHRELLKNIQDLTA